MSKKKTIAVAVVLALVLIIGGMLAYFTDTETKTNVFTLGDNVEISLTETGWTQDGQTSNWTRTEAQGVHPGTKVAKDPTINNDSTTTPAYVFAKITVPCYASTGTTVDTPLYKLLNSSDAALVTTVGSAGNAGWTLISVSSIDTTAKTITYVYAYSNGTTMTSLAENTSTTTPVFSKVQVDPNLTAAQKTTASATPNIEVKAYGIQTDGLDVTTPTDIFALFGNN